VASGVRANLEVVRTLNREIARLEREVSEQVKLAAQYEPLLSIAGIGRILALAIMLETGAIERFAGVGNFSSYARCVASKRLSNDKKKGEGNSKCGNKYLACAFVEAANFAVRYNARIKRFHQRNTAKTNQTSWLSIPCLSASTSGCSCTPQAPTHAPAWSARSRSRHARRALLDGTGADDRRTSPP